MFNNIVGTGTQSINHWTPYNEIQTLFYTISEFKLSVNTEQDILTVHIN